jgi:hypothetical protein
VPGADVREASHARQKDRVRTFDELLPVVAVEGARLLPLGL